MFLPHPLLVQAFNLYYDTLHFPVLIACLIWLFVRHRDRYSPPRTTLVALTGACLLIQLVPVAPPRMLPGTGLVDTAVLYHQSVYATHAGFDARPAFRDALGARRLGDPGRDHGDHHGPVRWRWLALLYPAATTLAVVVTANHYWMDGIVAGLILAVVLLVQSRVSSAGCWPRAGPDRRCRPADEVQAHPS